MAEGKIRLRPQNRNGHVLVEKLPLHPTAGKAYWLDSPNGRHEYLHLLFRFPARFHPPVVRWALKTYGKPGGWVLDPFVGSGTVPLEALSAGMSGVGIDVDPLACLIARAKSTPISERSLSYGLKKIQGILRPCKDRHQDRHARPGTDISPMRFERETRNLEIPPIPNITHWFRRYVIVDIARILWAIEEADVGLERSIFFDACMASVIRRVSNADPAPVSGLEVTSIQAEKNKIRHIDVFQEFFAKVNTAMKGMRDLAESASSGRMAEIIEGDSLDLSGSLQGAIRQRNFDLVVTSPPYCTAVEYSRRHKLEMFWLKLVDDADEHVRLRHSYIGRPHVRADDWDEDVDFGIQRLERIISRVETANYHKARSIRHYFSSMHSFLNGLEKRVKKKGTAVVVVGNSRICGVPIPTADLLAELAQDYFQVKKKFSYAVRNQFMQYGLWNGNGINSEHVLILRRR